MSKTEKYALDVYIRMNLDDERDYCFEVKETDTFRDLLKIFETLPLTLNPSLFYNRVPIGFKISRCPGILTMEGGLLFGREAADDKWLTTAPNDALVVSKVWPGQLLHPIWEERTFLKYSITAALLTWLYTDLPDFVSPTPGIGFTTILCKATCNLLEKYYSADFADHLRGELLSESTVLVQCVFFALNFFKVLIVYFALYFGAINPYSFTEKAPQVTREDLVAIGWTGAKKATLENFRESYRSYRIDQAGGVLKAHQAGLLTKLSTTTVTLGPEEGFNTPLDLMGKITLQQLEKQDKFQLSLDLLNAQEKLVHDELKDLDDKEFTLRYKKFRSLGPFKTTPEIEKIVQHRFEIEAEKESKKS
ncbi:hypothetical protein OGAPHI_000216 [Ogataea philodendri]|uniref:Uncharacterized protein n=1 Tax=Ogataea philodendri TaxID=1378263 RepID=A0A9P8PFX3_9ASCO|nr:uncharacterized protein OGAPHI_000216 [Ogataea philodendri]KAH3671513.1 hypothetical protein OGAPHI_000216 [Ogataea philodendri]